VSGVRTVTLKPLRTGSTAMIRIVWGTGSAESPSASFDVALAGAGVHQYNLREVSSVIPDGVPVEVAGTAPDLGPTGEAIHVAMARRTCSPGVRATAGLAWARDDGGDGPGVLSEVDDHDPRTVRRLLHAGIERGCDLRDMDDPDVGTKVVTAEPASNGYTTAVALAVYGDSDPLL
jgi:arginine decarboxylase